MFRVKIVLLLLFAFSTALAQSTNDNTHTRIDRKTDIESRIKKFADSLDSMVNGGLPDFLFNPCLDMDKSLWIDLDPTKSTRWAILQQVTNKASLKAIIDSRDKRLKLKCSLKQREGRQIEFANRSIVQLAKRRLKDLN